MSQSSAQPQRPRARPVRIALILGVVVVLAVVVTIVVALQSRDEVDTRPGVPPSALSPSGTPLPDGFTVPPGSRLVGRPAQTDGADPGTSGWTAVLIADSDPVRPWRDLVNQLNATLATSLDADSVPGCATADSGFSCLLSESGTVDGRAITVTAEISTVPGDVTGRYSILLRADRDGAPFGIDSVGWNGGDVPDAPDARPRPDVGGPLAPDTVAYDGDAEEYVLIAGSELLVQYSAGSATGGFGVLLRVAPGTSVSDVAAAYAEQASQSDGPIQSTTTVNADSTVTHLIPPGGGGGYAGEVYVVNTKTGDDYIYYSLLND